MKEIEVTLRDAAVRVRVLRPADAPALVALMQAVLEDGDGMLDGPGVELDTARFVDVLEASRSAQERGRFDFWLGAFDGDALVGELRVREHAESLLRDVATVSVSVRPGWRRRGLARALFQGLFAAVERDVLSRIELDVRADNHGAIALYRSFGFVEEGRRVAAVRIPTGEFVDLVSMAKRFRDRGAIERPSFAAVLEDIRAFVRERSWERFHDPKNLAMAVASEAGELCAELRWVSSTEADEIAMRPEQRARLADELADVAITVTMLADRLGLDLPTAMARKLRKNREKYPAERFRDRAE